jgi:hypothetical protein
MVTKLDTLRSFANLARCGQLEQFYRNSAERLKLGTLVVTPSNQATYTLLKAWIT